MEFIVVILVLVFFGGCFGVGEPGIITNYTPIYRGSSTLSIASVASKCSSQLMILANSTTTCIDSIDPQGVRLTTTCSSLLVGSIGIHCTSNYCFVLNSANVSVIGSNSPVVSTPFYAPTLITTTSRTSVITDILVVDKSVNSSIWLFSWLAGGSVSATLIANLTNSNPVVGISFVNSTTFVVGFAQDTTLRLYATSGLFLGTLGSFGSVKAVSRNHYGQTFVYDLGCSCIKVLDTLGNWTNTILLASTGLSALVSIVHSRDHTYVLDSLGVTRFYINFAVVNLTVTNSTCATVGGLVSLSITGGAAPYLYNVFPDYLMSNASTMSPSFSTRLIPRVPISSYYIYWDIVSVEFIVSATNNLGFYNDRVNASTFGSYSGGYCFGMQMVSNVSYSFMANFSVSYNRALWQSLQFMLNVGDGGQNFSISLGTITLKYGPGDLPLNTWNQVIIDLAPVTNATTYWSFTDLSGTNSSTNLVYIDTALLLPYPYNDVRTVQIVDFCGASLLSQNFSIFGDTNLAVNAVATPTSCAPGDLNATKAVDGVLTAYATGGTPPYTYNWAGLSSVNKTLGGLAAFVNSDLIYENFLTINFSDPSNPTGRNLSDTTYFRSAPYSFSMTPNAGETWVITSPTLYDAKVYLAVELWVNGGQFGQQFISIRMFRNGATVGTPIFLHTLAGLPSIPPNKWIKVRFPINSLWTSFTGIQLIANGAWNQPRIYFDDVALIRNKYLLTVTDSSNCSAKSSYVYMSSPAKITVAPVVSNVQCNAGSDGQVYLNITGGTSPYTYSWLNSSGNTMSGYSGSTIVSVSVSDQFKCSALVPTTQVSILEPPSVQLSYSVQDAKCYGGTGTATATAIGGTGPYRYKWTSLSTTSPTIVLQPAPFAVFDDSLARFFGLGTNTPNAMVVCTGVGNVSMVHSGYCAISGQQVNASSSNHIVSLGCSGCVPLTIYASAAMWIKLGNPTDAYNLSAVLYKSGVVVSAVTPLFNISTADSVGYDWTKVTFNLKASVGFIDYITIISNLTTMGSILFDDIVLIPSSKSSYSTGFSVNSGFKSIITAPASQYSIVVTDSHGCPFTQIVNISQPSQLSLEYQTTISSADDGRISINVTGGVPPYQYYWGGSLPNTFSVEGLKQGIYSIGVSDANGCVVNQTIEVSQKVKSSSSMITGIAVGVCVGVFALAFIAGFFVYYQRKQAVKALGNMEEGERLAYKIDFSLLEIGSMIGAGSFGEVFVGVYKGADVAVKKLKTQQLTKQQADEFAQESTVMVGLRHPNILLFMGVCLEPSNLCIVTELCPRGNLSEILRDKNIKLPNQLIYKMALDTLKGLQFIHNSGFVHRDLKSPNLLVDKYWCVKIADFGLSVAVHNSSDEAQVSLLWTAPEILAREPDCYSYASDMYSFGIILWELVAKKIPWENMAPGAITSKVVGGMRPPVPKDTEDVVQRLINVSWAQKVESRPSCKEARAIMENEIIPLYGEIETNSGSGSALFGNNHTPGALMPAPPPQPPFALLSANVMGATQLWAADPRMMSEALEGMLSIFKDAALKFSGYRISQDSPSLIAFANPINAINFCLETQVALREFSWPSKLLSYSEAREVRQNEEVIQRGLRVRMGVHWAHPTLARDQVNEATGYKGASMDIGVAISRHAQGGGILIDQEMYNYVMSSAAKNETNPFAINPTGAVVCEGKSLHLFKLAPAALKCLLDKEMETSGDPDEGLLEPWIIPYADVTVENVIGKGTMGEVYCATWNGTKVASKKFVQQKANDKLMLELRTEFAVLKKLNHPNLVRFEAMGLQPPNIFLLSEYLERGSLSAILHGTADLSWKKRIEIARQIATGMAYLHNNDIVHTDLKSPNILVSVDFTVKIADFGFSKIKAANQTMTQTGTVAWTAPEIFDGANFTPASDVYSYSVILWELIFRKKPWLGKHSMKVIQMLEMGNRLPLTNMPNDTPAFITPIMVASWDHKPEKRLTFPQILEKIDAEVPAPLSASITRKYK